MASRPRRLFPRARRAFILANLRWPDTKATVGSAAFVGPVKLGDGSPPAMPIDATPESNYVNSTLATIEIPKVRVATIRSFDGTNNNLAEPELGSAGERLLCVAPGRYSDGDTASTNKGRRSPCEIFSALAVQIEEMPPNDRQRSKLIHVWGQFIEHDVHLTGPPRTDREVLANHGPADDPDFDSDGTGTRLTCFNRSRCDPSSGGGAGIPRERINQVTAWIDGSTVYGSDQATADNLRTFENGQLRTSDRGLPPVDAAGNFMAGDVRVNENIELTSMHALFIREHNWWASAIATQCPALSDEEIYQQARAIVIAEIQVITYREFLPALLGPGAVSEYRGYDPFIDPSVANEFAAAAFRSHNFDMARSDIQRGLEQDLADYNAVREAYGLVRAGRFADISSDPDIQQSLALLYGNVNEVDLWLGGLAEDHVPGSLLGELFHAIVVDQFTRLRDADRYWYQNIFTQQGAAQLERTTLADVIRRNTNSANLEDDVFFMRSSVSGKQQENLTQRRRDR
jgi:hypothetical protein